MREILIERRKPPYGFVPPAGHVDSFGSFEEAARRELAEEVEFEADRIELLTEGRRENPCRRIDGNWHYWKIYQVDVSGDLKRSADETKQAGFYSLEQLRRLAAKTEIYLSGSVSEDVWESEPGLEPVWCKWLKELRVL